MSPGKIPPAQGTWEDPWCMSLWLPGSSERVGGICLAGVEAGRVACRHS